MSDAAERQIRCFMQAAFRERLEVVKLEEARFAAAFPSTVHVGAAPRVALVHLTPQGCRNTSAALLRRVGGSVYCAIQTTPAGWGIGFGLERFTVRVALARFDALARWALNDALARFAVSDGLAQFDPLTRFAVNVAVRFAINVALARWALNVALARSVVSDLPARLGRRAGCKL
jgi:hypothetical protein